MAADVQLGLRWALGVTFILAGAVKVGDSYAFEQNIAAYGIVPGTVRRPMARLLPLAEVIVGVTMAVGILPAAVGWVAFTFLVLFAGAVAWNLARGRRFDCGCGTMRETEISWGLVARDLALAAAALTVARAHVEALALVPGSARTAPAATGSVLVAIPLLVLMLLASSRLIVSVIDNRRTATHRATNESATGLVSIVQVDSGASAAKAV